MTPSYAKFMIIVMFVASWTFMLYHYLSGDMENFNSDRNFAIVYTILILLMLGQRCFLYYRTKKMKK